MDNKVAKDRDSIFEEEQAHLSRTYSELERITHTLADRIADIEQRAAEDKSDLSDEITLNATSLDEALETWAAFAAVNRVIDDHNTAIASASSKLSDARILLKQPYFAKIVIGMPNKEVKTIYIGTRGMTDGDYKRLVVDWRSPVAEVYYNQANGKTTYEANGKTIHVDLKLRRQFAIDKDILKAYFDTTLAIEDPLLWEVLASSRGSKMKAITTTIQQEQNTAIRHPEVPALMVAGVAGSGKTSVLLQRIAYLFYRHRDDLAPDQVFLLTPNPVFQRYISNVLPDLGESNPISMTWREFAEGILPKGMGAGKQAVAVERLYSIEENLADLRLTHRDYRPLACDGEMFVTANQIDGLMARFKHVPLGPRRITLVREELLKRFDQKLARMAAGEDAALAVEALSLDEQMRLFHETVSPQDDEEMRRLALVFLKDRYRHIRDAIEGDEWLRVDLIAMRLLGANGVSPLEWLFADICLTGLSAPDIRYVMVDEVQDYSLAHLLCLIRYFRRADFMLLGDENQALGSHASSFADVEALFRRERRQIDRCNLSISYRSTPQITRIFAHLAKDEGAMQIRSVHPDGAKPVILECATEDEYAQALKRAMDEALKEVGNARLPSSASGDGGGDNGDDGSCGNDGQGLAAIIVPNKAAYAQIQGLVRDDVALIDDAASLPARGLFALPLELAKGLEFDYVIIPDASASAYPSTDVSRRRLYTAISRATKGLTVLSKGSLTEWLKDAR